MCEAMTSKRVFRDRLIPFRVIEEINQSMFGKLDPELCLMFLDKIRESLIGTTVLLSDGRKAMIISAGSFAGKGPVIMTEDDEALDLGKMTDITILECIA